MRLIDADKARESATVDLIVHHLDRQPTVDAVPVTYGEWIYDGNGKAHCSECGEEVAEQSLSKFCPDCGAKMDKED